MMNLSMSRRACLWYARWCAFEREQLQSQRLVLLEWYWYAHRKNAVTRRCGDQPSRESRNC
jgi:hypothetical protein